MRILQIAPPWYPVPPAGYGGIEQVVATLCDGLVDAGHDVTLLAAGGSQTRARTVTTFRDPPTRHLGTPALELAHVVAGYRHADEYDLVHDHTLSGAALGAVSAGPAVVHTLHGPWHPDLTALYRRVSDRIHLVAISHDQARRTPIGISLAATIHNGIDVTALPFPTTKRDYLAFVGRASREKGPEVAVDVARRLGMHLKLLIKVNEQREHQYFATHLAPRLTDANVDVIRNAGAATRNQIVGGARALLFPIQWAEPFGLVPVEANALGTPVVAFDGGAVRETVAEGQTGFVVAPGDIEAFCAAVERVDELDPAACRHHARSHFDATTMVTAYNALYRSVTAHRRQHPSSALATPNRRARRTGAPA